MKIRTTKPEKGNKYYIRKASGGWSPCIKGIPLDPDCDVLANCVGYAIGRFNEESEEGAINLFTSMNAENFFANAYKWNCETGQEPKQGAIMCWAKGKPGEAKDGAGHVAIVEKVISSTEVQTSESGYKSYIFKTRTRTKGSNGKWGAGADYTFLGFIYNPHLKPEIPDIPGVAKDTTKDQVFVKISGLRVRDNASVKANKVGHVIKGDYYNYYEKASDNEYDWYRIGENQWIANSKDGKFLDVIPKVEPPKPTGLKVGDKVRIIASGYSNTKGKGGHKAYGIGWIRYVKKIYPGTAYPYLVGDNTGNTGYYKDSALRKL